MQLIMLRIQNKRVRLEEIQKKEGRLFISFGLFLFVMATRKMRHACMAAFDDRCSANNTRKACFIAVAMHPEEAAGGRFCRYTLKTRFYVDTKDSF